MSRPITIWSTSGNNRKDIESDAKTFGELQKDFKQHGIDFKNMSIVVGENNNSLESTDAALLDGPLTLFFFPRKVGSGAIDKVAVLKTFKQANKASKERLAKKNGYSSVDSFKAFLEGKGKSAKVTSVKPTPAKKVAPAKLPAKKVVAPVPTKPPKKVVARPNVADVVKSVASAKLSDDELQRRARYIRSSIEGGIK